MNKNRFFGEDNPKGKAVFSMEKENERSEKKKTSHPNERSDVAQKKAERSGLTFWA